MLKKKTAKPVMAFASKKAPAVTPMPWGTRPFYEYYEIGGGVLMALIVWSVVGWFINWFMAGATSGFIGSITAVIQIAGGVYIGYLTVEKFRDKISDAVIAGAITGFISGFVIMVFEVLGSRKETALVAPLASMLFVSIPALIGAYMYRKK